MNLVQAINGALSPFDVVITRRSTLNRTRIELDNAREELQSLQLASAVAEPSAAGEANPRAVAQSQLQLRDLRQELLRHQIAAKWSVIDATDRAAAAVLATRSCPLCGYEGEAASYRRYTTTCIFGGGVLERHQCPSCDVIFGADKMFRLSAAELTQEYEWHYKVYEEGDSTDAELRAFHSLSPRRDGIYLNYGAGDWSRSVQLLRDDGWSVFAYEPHSSASTKADWAISSQAELMARRFDGLYSNNVLEHLRQPVDDLRRMVQWLQPGARMAHATPCYEYTRFHLFFFPGRSRELLAHRAGLTIEHDEIDGHFMNCVFAAAPDSTRFAE